MKITMRNGFYFTIIVCIGIFNFSSCKKNEGTNIPYLFLKSGGHYISIDGNVVRGDTILVGVNAASNGLNLSNFSIFRKHDNAATDSIYFSETITSAPAINNYIKDFQIIIQNHAGKEEFTFQITDTGNQSESKIIVLNVL